GSFGGHTGTPLAWVCFGPGEVEPAEDGECGEEVPLDCVEEVRPLPEVGARLGIESVVWGRCLLGPVEVAGIGIVGECGLDPVGRYGANLPVDRFARFCLRATVDPQPAGDRYGSALGLGDLVERRGVVRRLHPAPVDEYGRPRLGDQRRHDVDTRTGVGGLVL